MQINSWQEFYDSLVIQPNQIPIGPPSEADIIQFEASHQIMLPKSYREFISVFGAGAFSVSLEIAGPGYREAAPQYDLLRAHDDYYPGPGELPNFPAVDREHAARLYYFGLEEERFHLGWDTQDIRDMQSSEYAIYRLSDYALEFVAASFKEMVEQKCDEMFAPDPDRGEERPERLRVFHPASYLPGFPYRQ